MTATFELRTTLAVLAIAAVGCAQNASLEATTVLNYNQCQGLEAGLTLVDYESVAGIRGGTLLSITVPEDPGEGGDLLLVAISRGEQPTPGYGLSLEDTQRRDGTAVVTVHWKTPEPGAVLAQMITHPCLVVGLPRNGVARIEAEDQTGTRLGSLDL